MVLLVLFSVMFGIFAGGYSAIRGGIIDEAEREAASRNEAIDTGIVYDLLGGARGLRYVTGGLCWCTAAQVRRGRARGSLRLWDELRTTDPLHGAIIHIWGLVIPLERPETAAPDSSPVHARGGRQDETLTVTQRRS